ncbi:SurA N-terminal domain-containing protein [Pseudomonas sp. JQ170]|uniref:SurA N-terminal domain-containing protein n=1 Tax=unclassified Pseudomonas TaxID=196821 RepID=UPI002653E3EE|nr:MULTISPECIES: SurA N-terminal domain-containing protein [unclassified Pseudomonas]MDN7140013.1 SurA N-terminal domain-containing protein [Pseudomonas sp. JQ170]WRO78626.1 SurA N-terminal domain-containing protein [Pseudomonas sp. 170C]
MKLLGLLLCLLALPLQAQEGPPAALVNGVAISQLRLDRYFTEYLEDRGRALTSIRNPSVYKRLRDQALNDLIDKELLWQEAQRQGVTVSDAEVNAQVEQLRQAFGSSQTFEQRLADAGFDTTSFAAYTRHELAAQRVFLAATQVPEPDAAQVKAFYLANENSFQAQQNQSASNPVEAEQGLALAKSILIDQQQAQARHALLQRLRDAGQVQKLD